MGIHEGDLEAVLPKREGHIGQHDRLGLVGTRNPTLPGSVDAPKPTARYCAAGGAQAAAFVTGELHHPRGATTLTLYKHDQQRGRSEARAWCRHAKV